MSKSHRTQEQKSSENGLGCKHDAKNPSGLMIYRKFVQVNTKSEQHFSNHLK
jgi:hypothetical protein